MTDASTGDPNLLKFLAIGRLAKGSSGGAVLARNVGGTEEEKKQTLGKHQVLAYAAASKDERTKIFKKHVKELMSKGASRLTGGKRVRLLSDEAEDGGGEDPSGRYELHVLTEYIDGDPNYALVFFAITSLDFTKHQGIATLFKDLKAGVYDQFDSETLMTTQSSGPMHGHLRRFFEQLFTKYNKQLLTQVSRKVEEVKEVMKDNVNKALNNVEQLEEMEVKAERMEDQAKLFERRSGSVLWLMRCRYIKITLILGLVVAAILAYIIYYIYSKTHSDDDPASPPVDPAPPAPEPTPSPTPAAVIRPVLQAMAGVPIPRPAKKMLQMLRTQLDART